MKNEYDIVSLNDLWRHRHSKYPLASITFDDGWRDNYTSAFPILHELGVSATVFVTTGKIGSNSPFWQQQLGRCFHSAVSVLPIERSRMFYELLSIPHNTAITEEVYYQTVKKWKLLDPSEREIKLNMLIKAIGLITDSSERIFLSIEEIQEMSQLGIDFGSHTVNHQILTLLSAELVKYELLESRLTLEEIVQKPVDILAYPNGDFSDSVTNSAQETGYTLGFSIGNSSLSTSVHQFAIPRLDIGWDSVVGLNGCFDECLFKLIILRGIYSNL